MSVERERETDYGETYDSHARIIVTDIMTGWHDQFDLRSVGLLDLLIFLREVGTPEELEDRSEKLESAFGALELEHLQFLDDDREIVESAVAAILAQLTQAKLRVAEAVQILADAGLRFDRDSGAKFLAGTQGGRPKNVLTAVVGEVWEDLLPSYKEQTGDSDWNNPPIRNMIAEFLAPFFTAEFIDASPKGPIDNAIRNYIGSRGS